MVINQYCRSRRAAVILSAKLMEDEDKSIIDFSVSQPFELIQRSRG